MAESSKAESAPAASSSSKRRLIGNHPKGAKWTPEEIDVGLTAIALASGSLDRARRMLADQGIEVSRHTLHNWRYVYHVDRYERIRAEVIPKLKAEEAELRTALATYQVEQALRAAELVAERVESMDDKSLLDALNKFNVGSGIQADKIAQLRGEPTSIIRHESVSEIERGLKRLGVVIEGEAVEEGPNELP